MAHASRDVTTSCVWWLYAMAAPDSTATPHQNSRKSWRHSSSRVPMDKQRRSHGSLCRRTALYVLFIPNFSPRLLLMQSGRRTDGPVLEPFLAKIVGAVLKLNPLLAPPPDTQDDYLRWNMLFHTSNCYRTTESQRSWVKGRNAPATHPRMTHVRIISRAFPWMIQVRAHNPKLGVTCGEVLDAVSTYMYGDVAKKEYENLPSGRKRQIWESYRFNRSTDSNAPGGRLREGLKRLDWLGSSSRFGGLVTNDTFVKEHCGDVLPCTFELKCLPAYPLTAEEVREQQHRLENSLRQRSQSWLANAPQPSQPPQKMPTRPTESEASEQSGKVVPTDP